jgi:putative ABC transport system permease protein
MNSGLSAPSWTAVGASLVLVALAAAIAYRQRSGLTHELIVAAVRAGIQLIAVGAVLGVIFAHGGLAGGLGWVVVMIVIAGQVAGRRGRGLRRARWSATAGVGAGTVITLGGLLLLGVIAVQPRVVVPLGGMIVSGAMLASGLTLRRLREHAEQARPAIESPVVPGTFSSRGIPSASAIGPSHRAAARNRFHQGRRTDQPARRDDRTDPGRGRPAHRHPLPDRGHVHAAGRHRPCRAGDRTAGRACPVRRRAPPRPPPRNA